MIKVEPIKSEGPHSDDFSDSSHSQGGKHDKDDILGKRKERDEIASVTEEEKGLPVHEGSVVDDDLSYDGDLKMTKFIMKNGCCRECMKAFSKTGKSCLC